MSKTNNLMIIDLHRQTRDNCLFMMNEDTEVSIITSKEPESGKYRAMAIKGEGYGRRKKRSVIFSDVGATIVEALELLHSKSAEALNHHIMTYGFAPVLEKRGGSGDWEDDGMTASSSSDSTSVASDDSHSSSSDDDQAFKKAKSKSNKQRSSSSVPTRDTKPKPRFVGLGAQVHVSGRPPPPPLNRMPGGTPLLAGPNPMGRGPPTSSWCGTPGITLRGVPPPPGMTGPSSAVNAHRGRPPFGINTMPVRPPPPGFAPGRSSVPSHPNLPTLDTDNPPSRDVRIAITWISTRHQFVVHCSPFRRSICDAATMYFRANRQDFIGGDVTSSRPVKCTLKEIVFAGSGDEEERRCDMRSYYGEDLSQICEAAAGAAKEIPLFEVTIIELE